MYHALTVSESIFKTSHRIAKAATVFGGLSALEILQYFGIYPGRFNPNDFLAYAAGVLVAIGIEEIISRKMKEDTVKTELPELVS